MLLYHGTSEANALQILQHGLMGRSFTGNDNWTHTVNSREDAVYLTTAYPLMFASQATTGESRLAVFEIDTDFLESELLVADEDAVEQACRGRDQLPSAWSMAQRTEYYRERIENYPYDISLQVLGTCAYLGKIGINAIKRVAYITVPAYVRMVQHGYDPQISVMAFMAIGERYMKSTKWLFDPENIQQEYIDFGNGAKHTLLPIMDDRSGIQIESMAS